MGRGSGGGVSASVRLLLLRGRLLPLLALGGIWLLLLLVLLRGIPLVGRLTVASWRLAILCRGRSAVLALGRWRLSVRRVMLWRLAVLRSLCGRLPIRSRGTLRGVLPVRRALCRLLGVLRVLRILVLAWLLLSWRGAVSGVCLLLLWRLRRIRALTLGLARGRVLILGARVRRRRRISGRWSALRGRGTVSLGRLLTVRWLLVAHRAAGRGKLWEIRLNGRSCPEKGG